MVVMVVLPFPYATCSMLAIVVIAVVAVAAVIAVAIIVC